MRISHSGVAMAVLALSACSADQATGQDTEAEGSVAAADETGGAPEQLILENGVADGAIRVEGTAPVGSASFDPECLIEENGVAGIGAPATLGNFAAAFQQGTVLSFYSTFMVDFSALCARSDGGDAICALAFAEDDYAPDAGVESLIVASPVCNTLAGVGPGTPVATAVEAYGAATFSFSWENEGREFVSFANAPQNYIFRARSEAAEANAANGGMNSPGGEHGGDYSGVEGDGSYFESDTGYPDAEIREVWISWPIE